MIYHILFWGLCTLLAAHVGVAIIAIAKAYRDERRLALTLVLRKGIAKVAGLDDEVGLGMTCVGERAGGHQTYGNNKGSGWQCHTDPQ